MEWIPNQPVFFGDKPCESCDGDYAQLSDNTDTIQFQLSLDNCGAAQLLEDFTEYPYNDWVLGDGWSIVDDTICHTGTALIGMYQPLAAADFPTGYYQITIIVDSFNGVGGVDVKIGNIVDGSDTIGTITGVGTWNFFAPIVPATGFFPNLLQFYPTVAGCEICFSEISAYKILTNLIIPFYDSDGNFITEISYANHDYYFVLFENSITVTFPWNDLDTPISNDCVYMCILDPCENTGGQNYAATITNPGFTGSATGWTLEGEVHYSSNTVVWNGTDYGFILQNDVFSGATNQCVYVNVTAISGTLNVSFGSLLIDTITTTGIHKICGVSDGTSITIGALIGTTATVTSVTAVTVETSDYTCNAQSNTFKVGNWANFCTTLINACNNDNGLGFVFGNSGFNPRLRIKSKLKGMKYPSERSVYQTSDGTKSVVYFSGRKAKNFTTDFQPEYIHDFLRLLFGFDNFYIDNVLYFVEDDEYTVEINDANDNIGKAKFLVSTKTQDVKNKNCSGTENDCSLA